MGMSSDPSAAAPALGLAAATPGTVVVAAAAATAVAAGLYYVQRKKLTPERVQAVQDDLVSSFAKGSKGPSPPSHGASGDASRCPYIAGNAAKSYPAAAKLTDGGVVTGLTNKRSSEGIGLPEAVSQATIDIIVATTPAVAPKLLDITRCFYAKVLEKHPELKQFFNPSHNVPISNHQPKALAGALAAYATHIKDLSPLLVPGGPAMAICHRHAALALHPMQYVVVHDGLMAAVGEVLGDIVTPEIGAAWSEAVLFLAKTFIDTEEGLYQMIEKREGGWSGFAEFEVSKIVDLTDDVRQISFKPPAGSPLEGKKFDFTAGQYLSLQVDIDGDNLSAPRHYTCTGPVGADYLQCTVKKIPGGKVSSYVHEQLKAGDRVTLSAPLGVFTAPEEPTSAVLLSAGIGVTPMVNLFRAIGKDVKLVVHVDKSEGMHPYKSFFDETGSETLYKYTSTGGRPSAADLASEAIARAGVDNEFFCCGPEKWMDELQAELLKGGAKKVICEVFGSQLATGCPFFAGAE